MLSREALSVAVTEKEGTKKGAFRSTTAIGYVLNVALCVGGVDVSLDLEREMTQTADELLLVIIH